MPDVLVHLSMDGQHVLGVWLSEDDSAPKAYYDPPEPVAENYAYAAVRGNGTDPTWAN